MKTKIDESNYTVESHIYKATQKVRKLFFLIDPEIMKLENVVKYAKRNYIGYKLLIARSLFVEMHLQKERIVLHLRNVDYYASKLIVLKKPDSHKWTLNRLVSFDNEQDLDEIRDLVKQSHCDVTTFANGSSKTNRYFC